MAKSYDPKTCICKHCESLLVVKPFHFSKNRSKNTLRLCTVSLSQGWGEEAYEVKETDTCELFIRKEKESG